MLTIRRLVRHELGELLALYRHLHAADEAPSSEIAEVVWREICGNPRISCLGAFRESLLIGSCTLSVIPNLTRGGKPYGIIENVVTHKDFRQQGVGKSVLGKALSEAWAAGCYKVMLASGRRDETTKRFYAAAGFSEHEKQAYVARPEA